MTGRQAFEVFAVGISIPLFAIGIYRTVNNWDQVVAMAERATAPDDETNDSDSEPEEPGGPDVAAAPVLASSPAVDDAPDPPPDTPANHSSSLIRHFVAPGLAEELPFSSAVQAGATVYVSGTLGLKEGTRTPPENPSAEATLVMENFARSVKLAGASMGDVVNVTVFCSDPELYDTFNAVYRTYFEAGRFPARAFIITSPLLFGARFEVKGIAIKRE